MRSLNRCTILGYVGAAPVVRSTEAGTVTSFSVATAERWKSKDGKEQERTEWHPCVVFGPFAEIVGKLLTRGDVVMVEGAIRRSSYVNSDGVERFKAEVIVSEVYRVKPGKVSAESSVEGGNSAEEQPF